MKIDYRHGLGKDDARARLQAMGEYFNNKHGIRVTWSGDDRATFKGKYMVVQIEGELEISDDRVHFAGKDPGMLWRKKAQSYIQSKLESYLDPKTPLEDLPRG